MCGIVGYVGKQKVAAILIEGLKRLEYRGYDSAGLAVLQSNRIDVAKKTGRVENLAKETARRHFTGTSSTSAFSTVSTQLGAASLLPVSMMMIEKNLDRISRMVWNCSLVMAWPACSDDPKAQNCPVG